MLVCCTHIHIYRHTYIQVCIYVRRKKSGDKDLFTQLIYILAFSFEKHSTWHNGLGNKFNKLKLQPYMAELLLASGGIPTQYSDSCLGIVLFQRETDSQLGGVIRFTFITLNSGTLNNIEQCFSALSYMLSFMRYFSTLAISMLTGKFWQLNSTRLKGEKVEKHWHEE